jgi:hypothetical protein
MHAEGNQPLKPAALQCFIVCSITLHDILVSDPAALPHLLRNSLIRDLKMVYRMQHIIRQSVEASRGSLTLAINGIWPDVQGAPPRKFSRFEFMSGPLQWWVELTVDATTQTIQQTVAFHLLEGRLLINGKPIGKLPPEYRTSIILQELFGNQSLLTYPPHVHGMTYMLAMNKGDHQIHFGIRGGNLVVRAFIGDAILELIPRNVFGGSDHFDLPASLVRNCIHWLNVQTGMIEIRPQSTPWKSKGTNWVLNFNARSASAWSASRGTVRLVDPRSNIFSRVAQIFDKFEYRQYLTVYQPDSRRLTVDLRRLELRFFVNDRNLLESDQLQAEITPDQDIGTWYGLGSKVVMKEVIGCRDPRTHQLLRSEPGSQRSVLVPIGDIKYKRSGSHVTVRVENLGKYGRYTINEILKRLDCPADPQLLYLKALHHAYTSSVLPDLLTSRTGIEEALHCLKSGHCQPCTPITEDPQKSLRLLAKFTPHREYYPKEIKVMQKTRWDPELPAHIQHDGFRSIVEDIRTKSELLSMFTADKDKFRPLESGGERHLILRSQARREAHQRPDLASSGQRVLEDLHYIARDRWNTSQARKNVFECTGLIRDWPSKVHPTTLDLAGTLQGWSDIAGYYCFFDKILITDLLNLQFKNEWGPLVNLCRNSSSEDKYRLMFLLGVISYRLDVDMAVVRTLIAFALLTDLKTLDPPKWPCYSQFRYIEPPRLGQIVQLMKPCLVPYDDDDRVSFGLALSLEQRRGLLTAELEHAGQQQKDAKALGEFLLAQWPCSEPISPTFGERGRGTPQNYRWRYKLQLNC